MKKLLLFALVFSVLLTACGKSGTMPEKNNSRIEGNSSAESKSAFTMVKLEVNPAFYLFFDENEKSVDFEPLNDDAKTLSFDEIKGLSMDEAAKAILLQMFEKGFLKDGEIKITVLTDNDTNSVYESIVKGQIEQFAKDNGLNITVAVFPATDDEKAAFSRKKDSVLTGNTESQITSDNSSSGLGGVSSIVNGTASKPNGASSAPSSKVTSSKAPVAPAVNTRGNSTGNITNGGYAAIQGDVIYYHNGGDNGKLYKIKTDGSGKQKLSDDKADYINVIGDWIYYIAGRYSNEYGGQVYDDNTKMYRMKTDGTQRQLVN